MIVLCFFLLMLTLVFLKCIKSIKQYENGTNDDFEFLEGVTRFLVIIPVKNEENLLEQAIRSIDKSKYEHDKICVVILDDNSTDNSVAIAEGMKKDVYKIHINRRATKGGALEYFFKYNKSLIDQYNAICIIDADCVIEEEFFMQADRELQKGHKIIQGQLIVDNNTHSSIAGAMKLFQVFVDSLFYKYFSMDYHSIISAGKGICIDKSIILNKLWEFDTLVEDAEFSFDVLTKGYKIAYSDKMKVHFLQPDTIKKFWHQQRRWLSGQLHLIKILRDPKPEQHRDYKSIKCLRYYVIMGKISPVMGVGLMFLFVINVLNTIFALIIFYFFLLSLSIIIVINFDSIFNFDLKDMLVFPILILFELFIYLVCVFNPVRCWVPIKYTNISVNTENLT